MPTAAAAAQEEIRDLVTLLEKSCAKYAKRPLFGTRPPNAPPGTEWDWTTYEEFGRMVKWLRGGLSSMGLGPGDTLALISGNRVEWAACAYAAMGLGATFVPMYESQSEEDWRYIIEDSGAKMLIVSTAELAERLAPLAEELPLLESVKSMEPQTGRSTYGDIVNYGRGLNVPARPANPDQLACIIYTSGTTGRPKGVMLSHGNIVSNLTGVSRRIDIIPNDRCLSFLPWAHSFGQTCELHAFISFGGSIAINEDTDRLVDEMSEVRPTVLCAVPRIFNRIHDKVRADVAAKPKFIGRMFERALGVATRISRGESVSRSDRMILAIVDRIIFAKVRRKFGGRLKYAISGGAALSPTVAEFIDALGIEVYEGYGLSETSPIVACNSPGMRKLGSVGRPLHGVTVIIDVEAMGPDWDKPDQGEILVRGPNVMLGYHNLSEETDRAITPAGEFRTGDVGYFDEEGYLFITGRIKEQYKLENGKYVAPAPYEEALKLSPLIANVMVYGDNRPYNVAVVVPDREALMRHLNERLKSLPAEPADKTAWMLTETERSIGNEIAKRSSEFPAYYRVRRFALVEEDFTQENGLLTPTLKLKRRQAFERFGQSIEELYRNEVQTGA